MIDLLVISDCVNPQAGPEVLTEAHRDMLDELNVAAREARWPGLQFSFYGYDNKKGVIQIQARPGTKPGTLHLLKSTAKELRAKGEIEQGGIA